MVLLAFQFYPVFNFGKFINFGLGTVRGERVKTPGAGMSAQRANER